jgi:carbonic anhydrase
MNNLPLFTPLSKTVLSKLHLKTTRARVLALFVCGVVLSTVVVSAKSGSLRQLVFGKRGESTMTAPKTAASRTRQNLSVSATQPARPGETTTTLKDGRILTAGGRDGNGQVVSSFEVFDPTTNAFVFIGSLLHSRVDHTASLLSDGRVLIAGGSDGQQALRSTEIFDPASGISTAGPDMAAARSGHSANAIHNGDFVLIIGGDGSGEMFNVRTGSFSGPSSRAGSLSSVSNSKTSSLQTAESSGGASIWTDREDYPPYSVVVISGSGFTAGETVDMVVEQISPAQATYAPWSTVADDQGNISTTWFVFSDELVGAILKATATGQTSGLSASTTFTDALSAGVAPNGDPNGFNIDGSVRAVSTASPAPTALRSDWLDSSAGGSGGIVNENGTVRTPASGPVYLSNDLFGNGSGDDVFSGSVKADQNPNTMTWDSAGNNQGKTDLNRVYVHISHDTAGDAWVTASADRGSTSGAAYVDFELNQVPVIKNANGTFSSAGVNGGRTANDMLITAEYSGNGTPTLKLFKWELSGGSYVWVDHSNDTSIQGKAFAASNSATLSLPYTSFGSGTYTAGQFVEMSVNVSALVAAGNSCAGIGVSTVWVRTKTANSTSANMADFATPISVSFNAGFTATASASPNTYPGTINTIVSGGTGTKSYALTGGSDPEPSTFPSSTGTFTNLIPGTYKVWVKDSPGCVAGSNTVTINPAPVTATAGSGSNVYDGATHAPSACAVTGAYTGDLACTNSPALAGPGVGTTAITANVTGTNLSYYAINYVGGSYTISPAGSTTTVSCGGPYTYTGSAIVPPCTYEVKGTEAGTPVLASGNVAAGSHTNNINVGTGSASYTYAGDANHTGSSNSGTFTIGPAGSTTTVTCGGPYTYTGSAIVPPCTYEVKGTEAGTPVLASGNVAAGSHTNNINVGTGSASYTFAGDANHTGSSNSGTFTISPAGSTTTVTCGGPYTYTGSAIVPPCTYEVKGTEAGTPVLASGNVAAGSHTNNINVGTGSASYTYAGDANHTGSSNSGTFTIGPAGSTTTVTCGGPYTYTGSAIVPPCTYEVKGTEAGTPVLASGNVAAGSHTNNINVGTGSASYTYGGDANHTGSSNSGTFTIGPAGSTTTVSCGGPYTYTGSAIVPPCTYEVKGTEAGTPVLASGNVVAGDHTNNINVGTGSASYTFAGDSNHTGSSNSGTFTIGPAGSTTTVSCGGPYTYTGSAIVPPCTYEVKGTEAGTPVLASGNVAAGSHTNNINVGTGSASYTYAGDANHTGSSNSGTFTIGPAGSTTTVSCGGPYTYTGSAIVPPCTYEVKGTEAGTPVLASGNVAAGSHTNNINVGTGSASYTYGGDANHTGSSNSGTFTISPAGSTTTVSCGGPYTYTGSAIVPPCTYEVKGTEAGTPVLASGNVAAGSHTNNINVGTGSASYTYGGDANHTGSSNSGTFTIGPAGSTTTVSCGGPYTYTGSAIVPPCTYEVKGTEAGTPVLASGNVAAGDHTNNINVGTGSASYTYAGDANHTGSSNSGTFTIGPAGSTTTVSCGGPYTYTGSAIVPPCTYEVKGTEAGTPVLASGNVAAGSHTNNINVGTGSASYTYGGDANHTGSSNTGTFTIDPKPVDATAGGYTGIYDGNTHALSACVVTGFAGLSCTNNPVGPVGPGFGSGVVTPDTSGISSNFAVTPHNGNWSITKAPTQITFNGPASNEDFLCGAQGQYTATLRDTYNNTPLSGISLTLTIGSQTATGTTNASGIATFSLVLNQAPGTPGETVGITNPWTDPNRSAPPLQSGPFTVLPDSNIGPGAGAGSLYTGPSFFWTTSPTSSTATLTLNATIKDTSTTCPGDITKAKVSFFVSQNGGTSFSPVSNAQNLPVGRVNPTDSTVGTASTTSQYNIGSDKFASLVIRVVVGGQYTSANHYSDWDVPVVVAVPGQPNTLAAGGTLPNTAITGLTGTGFPVPSTSYFADGYLGFGNGTSGGGSSVDAVTFGGFVQCNNTKCTNPQGQINATIDSFNKPDGSNDYPNHHHYFVKSNAISGWGTASIGSGYFSAKTNVYETTGDTRTGIDGGGMMQMVFANPGGKYTYNSVTGGNKKVELTCPATATNGCASIVVYRSNGLGGGVWFASAWGPVSANDLPQTIMKTLVNGKIAYTTGSGALGAPVMGAPTSDSGSAGNGAGDTATAGQSTATMPTTVTPTQSSSNSTFIGVFVSGSGVSPNSAKPNTAADSSSAVGRTLFVGQTEARRNAETVFVADGTLGKRWVSSRLDNSIASLENGTTPDGRVTVTVRSCNKADGSVDTRCSVSNSSTHHVYIFETNALTSASLLSDVATVESKATVYELLASGERRMLEKDVAMQIVFVPENQMIPLFIGAAGGSACGDKAGCAAIAVLKTDGSLWYSGGWRLSLSNELR